MRRALGLWDYQWLICFLFFLNKTSFYPILRSRWTLYKGNLPVVVTQLYFFSYQFYKIWLFLCLLTGRCGQVLLYSPLFISIWCYFQCAVFVAAVVVKYPTPNVLSYWNTHIFKPGVKVKNVSQGVFCVFYSNFHILPNKEEICSYSLQCCLHYSHNNQ